MAIEPLSFGKNKTIYVIISLIAMAAVLVFLFFRLRISGAPSRLSPELQQRQQELAEEELRMKRDQGAGQGDVSGGIGQGGAAVAPIPETPEQKRERGISNLNNLFEEARGTVASAFVDPSQKTQSTELSPEEADQVRKEQLGELDALMRDLQTRYK
jgi:hypothetical protein